MKSLFCLVVLFLFSITTVFAGDKNSLVNTLYFIDENGVEYILTEGEAHLLFGCYTSTVTVEPYGEEPVSATATCCTTIDALAASYAESRANALLSMKLMANN